LLFQRQHELGLEENRRRTEVDCGRDRLRDDLGLFGRDGNVVVYAGCACFGRRTDGQEGDDDGEAQGNDAEACTEEEVAPNRGALAVDESRLVAEGVAFAVVVDAQDVPRLESAKRKDQSRITALALHGIVGTRRDYV
jgi:hypothetical protein